MKLYRFYLRRSDFKINNHQNIQIVMSNTKLPITFKGHKNETMT